VGRWQEWPFGIKLKIKQNFSEKMAVATELFVSRPTFEPIQNLHSQLYKNLDMG
jgi:hypothetical protein